MNRFVFPLVAGCLLTAGCGAGPSAASQPATKILRKPKVTQFYSSPTSIPKGTQGSLCYGVEGATRVTLQPPVAEVWPAASRCVGIHPDRDAKYTLTAFGEDGSQDVQTVEVTSAPAPPPVPRLYDLWANSLEVGAGEQVKICFKTEHAIDVEASPGTLYKQAGCLTDYPKATTTYKLAAVGSNNQRDRASVTVKVR